MPQGPAAETVGQSEDEMENDEIEALEITPAQLPLPVRYRATRKDGSTVVKDYMIKDCRGSGAQLVGDEMSTRRRRRQKNN